ncbi:MAG TPA: prepilin-type N-terminal cleavage/methylation domain-containing protein [Sedimentisphaerales bacterium]|nr:prepilin-type N-terminal cleavage/methylation domain-containing protein [Sedimentisphaerales bacterium]
MQARRRGNSRAFTLVELMVGLMVTSIILSAVATLAFAMSRAGTAGGGSARIQARIRHTTVYLSELVSNCKLICAAPDNDLVLWRADDNNNGRINLDELIYIERGSNRDMLRLCRFSAATNPEYTLSQLAQPLTKNQLRNLYSLKYTPLISDCSNVQFDFFGVSPPRTRLLAVTFGFVENGVHQRYENVVAVRSRAGYLLSPSNEIVTSDDD